MDRLSRKWEIDRERERGREAKGEKQKRTRATQNKLCLWWMLRSEIETSSFSHPLLPYYLFSSPLCPSVFPPHLTHLCLYVSLYLSASLTLPISFCLSHMVCHLCDKWSSFFSGNSPMMDFSLLRCVCEIFSSFSSFYFKKHKGR